MSCKNLNQVIEVDRTITYGVVKPGPEDVEGVPFVRSGDISGGKVEQAALRTITRQLSETYKRTILRGGELLISLVGNPGEVAIAPSELAGANIARQVGLVPLSDSVDRRFVMYYLRSPAGRAQLFTRTQGAVQQVINLADLRTVEIPDINIAQQRRIASILSAYDDLIENNRRRIQLLEESARLLYKEWFVQLRFPGHEHTKIVDGVPEGWTRLQLGKLATLRYGKALKADDRVIGKFPVYGSSGIIGYHNKSMVSGPSIIVGRKGNVGSVYWCDLDCHPIDTVYFIGSSEASFYLYNALQDLDFINSDAAVPGLNRDFAHSRTLLLPAGTYRTTFEEVITPIFSQISLLQKQNEYLQSARDLLIPLLINGDLHHENKTHSH